MFLRRCAVVSNAITLWPRAALLCSLVHRYDFDAAHRYVNGDQFKQNQKGPALNPDCANAQARGNRLFCACFLTCTAVGGASVVQMTATCICN